MRTEGSRGWTVWRGRAARAGVLAVLAVWGLHGPAGAQVSPDCSGGPCVKVGLADDRGGSWDFWGNSKYLLYCEQGATVQVDVLAKFVSGLHLCGDCSHGDRAWTWTVSGATSYTQTGEEVVSSTERVASFTVSGAGDTITVGCQVGALPQGACECDSHSGDHGGASASCTFKLWRMALTCNADLDTTGYPNYKCVMASNITSAATLYGASAISPQGDLHSYDWASTLAADTDVVAQELDASSWAGKLVTGTDVRCVARARNPYVTLGDPGWYASHTKTMRILPKEHRPGWHTSSVGFAGLDETWGRSLLWMFPRPGALFGRNTNSHPNQDYVDESLRMVLPEYANFHKYQADYYAFDQVVQQVSSGPNTGYWYNSDPNLFWVDRQALINYWITDGAGWPSDPPTGPNGAVYRNWLDMNTVLFGDRCDPIFCGLTAHVGCDIRYLSTVWHETYGFPGSPIRLYLGHQGLIEEAVLNREPDLYDPVYMCDLLAYDTKETLRNYDDWQEETASANILEVASSLHGYINPVDPNYERHNGIWQFYYYDPQAANPWRQQNQAH